MKRIFVRGVSVTFFVFLVMIGFSRITQLNLFSAFDPISKALQEFELTDYVFSSLRPDPIPDPRIVLVNLAPNRLSIAQQVQIINRYKPKVIGIDSFFNCEGGLYNVEDCPQLLDTLGNLILSNAIQEAGNVVLVSRLLQTDSMVTAKIIDEYDSIEYSDAIFSDHSQNGFANLVSGATYQEDIKICKSFVPKVKVNGKDELAFSVQLMMNYDSAKTKRFLARNNYEEIINYSGNFDIQDIKIKGLRNAADSTSAFRSIAYAIDWNDILEENFDSSMFKNSIVMMGFLGTYFGDPSWNDRWFTPLNTKVAGRANPDMFGLVVHANIVAMILDEDYVNQIPDWLQYVIAFFVCFLNVLLFTWVDNRFPVWFDALSAILQLVQILLVSMVIVSVFSLISLKLELSITIGALALIGPCFDIYKSIENTFLKQLT